MQNISKDFAYCNNFEILRNIFRNFCAMQILLKYCEIYFEIFALCKIFRNIAKYISKFLHYAKSFEILRKNFRNFLFHANISKYSSNYFKSIVCAKKFKILLRNTKYFEIY